MVETSKFTMSGRRERRPRGEGGGVNITWPFFFSGRGRREEYLGREQRKPPLENLFRPLHQIHHPFLTFFGCLLVIQSLLLLLLLDFLSFLFAFLSFFFLLLFFSVLC